MHVKMYTDSNVVFLVDLIALHGGPQALKIGSFPAHKY